MRWTVLLLLAACGGLAAQADRARSARYAADEDVVWRASRTALGQVSAEDHERGVLVGRWQVVDLEADQQHQAAGTKWHRHKPGDAYQTVGNDLPDDPAVAHPPPPPGRAVPTQVVYRLVATIQGPPPYRVIIRGQAAEIRAGENLARPIEDPPWLAARVDEAYARLWDQLGDRAR